MAGLSPATAMPAAKTLIDSFQRGALTLQPPAPEAVSPKLLPPSAVPPNTAATQPSVLPWIPGETAVAPAPATPPAETSSLLSPAEPIAPEDKSSERWQQVRQHVDATYEKPIADFQTEHPVYASQHPRAARAIPVASQAASFGLCSFAIVNGIRFVANTGFRKTTEWISQCGPMPQLLQGVRELPLPAKVGLGAATFAGWLAAAWNTFVHYDLAHPETQDPVNLVQNTFSTLGLPAEAAEDPPWLRRLSQPFAPILKRIVPHHDVPPSESVTAPTAKEPSSAAPDA
jgi:hypothetical protein